MTANVVLSAMWMVALAAIVVMFSDLMSASTHETAFNEKIAAHDQEISMLRQSNEALTRTAFGPKAVVKARPFQRITAAEHLRALGITDRPHAYAHAGTRVLSSR